jgi:NAD(P)-dependent dehydrogenase (short-subunit alcohol dehydrogenase family)
MDASLKNKTALVTGATSGIGYQAALDLARAGARVIGTGRDTARCQRARVAILQEVPLARVEFQCADFSSLRQVRDLAETVNQSLATENGKLDLLVNNAGLYSSAKKMTEDGLELTFAVNHLAPFLLTHLLLPTLGRSPDARVLTVSSNDHYYPYARVNVNHIHNPRLYIGYFQYAKTKLCNVLFSAEFNRRARPGLQAWAIDPGLVSTNMALKDGGRLSSLVWRVRKQQGASPEKASATICRVAGTSLSEIRDALYWKNSQPKAPSRLSRNADLARDLWEQSCRLCGIGDFFNNAYSAINSV